MTTEKTIMITLESSQFLVLSIQEENKIYNRNKFSMQQKFIALVKTRALDLKTNERMYLQ